MAEPPSSHVSYLYVDSSGTDLSNQGNWKVFGRSVELKDTSKLPIMEADLPRRIEEVDKYPGLKDWVGDRKGSRASSKNDDRRPCNASAAPEKS